jgi:hypothetical protein
MQIALTPRSWLVGAQPSQSMASHDAWPMKGLGQLSKSRIMNMEHYIIAMAMCAIIDEPLTCTGWAADDDPIYRWNIAPGQVLKISFAWLNQDEEPTIMWTTYK